MVHQTWGVCAVEFQGRVTQPSLPAALLPLFALSYMGWHRRPLSLWGLVDAAPCLGSCRQTPAPGCLNLHVPAALAQGCLVRGPAALVWGVVGTCNF